MIGVLVGVVGLAMLGSGIHYSLKARKEMKTNRRIRRKRKIQYIFQISGSGMLPILLTGSRVFFMRIG